MSNPVAFLCHASEDKETVRALARGLMAHGVEVFFDEWEIGPGDSIRQRLDDGLGKCTHFVAVLTSTSLNKPWVNLELDAGLVRRVEGQARFIPLRLGLPVSGLPPLLRGMHSPSIGDPEMDSESLAAFMHGVSLKPPIGRAPSPIRDALPSLGMSPAAQAIARLRVERSSRGRPGDPQLQPDQIMSNCSLDAYSMIDGIDELVATGLVRKVPALGVKHFYFVTPHVGFFATFDRIFHSTDPHADGRQIAVDIVNNGETGALTSQLAARYGWAPRRMNPATEYLIVNNLMTGTKEIDPEWSSTQVMATPATRRFVQELN